LLHYDDNEGVEAVICGIPTCADPPCGWRDNFVTGPSQTSCMTEIETEQVPRTLADILFLWRRAYLTRIFDESHEAIGRGPTYQASREAALEMWVRQWQREHEGDLSRLE
jgi:hypothetical protein